MAPPAGSPGPPRGPPELIPPQAPFAPVDAGIQRAGTRAAATLTSFCPVEPVSFDWEDRLPISFTLDMLVVETNHYFTPFVLGYEDQLSGSITGLLDAPMPTLID